MNSHLRFRFAGQLLVPALFVICLAGCAGNPKPDINKTFAGLYKLYIIESIDSSGTWKEAEWAKGGESYILYDGLGHMAVEITPKGYKDFDWMKEDIVMQPQEFNKRIDSLNCTQLKAATTEFAANYVYVANYAIDETTGVITHHRLTATVPSNWGTDVKRKYSFSGDTLTLQILNGNLRLRWIRQQ